MNCIKHIHWKTYSFENIHLKIFIGKYSLEKIFIGKIECSQIFTLRCKHIHCSIIVKIQLLHSALKLYEACRTIVI